MAGRLTLSELDELTQVLRAPSTGRCGPVSGTVSSTPRTGPPCLHTNPAWRSRTMRCETLSSGSYRRSAGGLRQLITRWAESYRAAGWPGDTPDYLLTDYRSFLAGIGNVEDLSRASPTPGATIGCSPQRATTSRRSQRSNTLAPWSTPADLPTGRWATLLAEREPSSPGAACGPGRTSRAGWTSPGRTTWTGSSKCCPGPSTWERDARRGAEAMWSELGASRCATRE